MHEVNPNGRPSSDVYLPTYTGSLSDDPQLPNFLCCRFCNGEKTTNMPLGSDVSDIACEAVISLNGDICGHKELFLSEES